MQLLYLTGKGLITFSAACFITPSGSLRVLSLLGARQLEHIWSTIHHPGTAAVPSRNQRSAAGPRPPHLPKQDSRKPSGGFSQGFMVDSRTGWTWAVTHPGSSPQTAKLVVFPRGGMNQGQAVCEVSPSQHREAGQGISQPPLGLSKSSLN